MNKKIDADEMSSEPTIAPAMEDDPLEEKATAEEIKAEDSTKVTKLFLDRI